MLGSLDPPFFREGLETPDYAYLPYSFSLSALLFPSLLLFTMSDSPEV